MKANIACILWMFICLLLNSCSKGGNDALNQEQEHEQGIAFSSLKQKSISLSLINSEIADKVSFDIGENVEYFKLSSGKARKITEPYCKYTKKSGEEASLEIEFSVGNTYYYWEMHLEFKKENSGSYIGIVEYGDDENYKEETIYGTFIISNYSNEGNKEQSEIDIDYLVKNVWYSTETDLKRFFVFFDDYSYKHYCDLGNTIVKDEGGEYVFDEDEGTLKLYNSNNKCDFDFKILKLTESELWFSVYDVIDKKYPSSPSIELRIVKESDDVPEFITGKENKNIDFKYLTNGFWVSYHETVNEFLRFDDDASFKRYLEFAHGNIIKEKGKFVVDEDENTIKFYDDNNSLLHDFKVFKLTEKEFWTAANKEYLTSPTSELSLAKDDDDIPRFILDKESEVDDDFSISEPIIEGVGTNSVIIKGTIIGEGVNFKNRGFCISMEKNPTVDDICITQNSNVINGTIKDLYPGTTYYVRLYAEVYNQIFYGEQVSFTTIGDKIEKIILSEIFELTNLKKSQIHIEATLPYEVSKYGLCYGKNPHPQITDKVMAEVDSKTSWVLTDIECGNDYYVRAYHIEGANVVYYEDSEIKIHPLNKDQLTCEFNFSIYPSSYNLSITLKDFPIGEYEVIPTVWRWKDAYYKEHEGKNYDQPKKTITVGREPLIVKFNGTLSTSSHQMPPAFEDLNYYFDFLKIIPVSNDGLQKEWHITKDEL